VIRGTKVVTRLQFVGALLKKWRDTAVSRYNEHRAVHGSACHLISECKLCTMVADMLETGKLPDAQYTQNDEYTGTFFRERSALEKAHANEKRTTGRRASRLMPRQPEAVGRLVGNPVGTPVGPVGRVEPPTRSDIFESARANHICNVLAWNGALMDLELPQNGPIITQNEPRMNL
jgi:hypothetical protein